MTTFADLIDEARWHLMTGQPDRLNELSGSMTDSQDNVPLVHGVDGINPGARLTVGLEEMHVLSARTNSATVIRGFGGSTATTHDSGDTVYVNPQFSPYHVSREINRAFDTLSSDGLFRIKDAEITYIPTRSGYDLSFDADFIDIWRVRYDSPGPSRRWRVLRPQEWYVDLDPDAGDFPSGAQLVLLNGGFPGHTVRVSYKAGFAKLSALSDQASVSGLHSEAFDLLPLAAALRITTGREIKRSFLNRQPEPRRQEEVPPGAARQSRVDLIGLYLERLSSETARLRRRYPGAA